MKLNSERVVSISSSMATSVCSALVTNRNSPLRVVSHVLVLLAKFEDILSMRVTHVSDAEGLLEETKSAIALRRVDRKLIMVFINNRAHLCLSICSSLAIKGSLVSITSSSLAKSIAACVTAGCLSFDILSSKSTSSSDTTLDPTLQHHGHGND